MEKSFTLHINYYLWDYWFLLYQTTLPTRNSVCDSHSTHRLGCPRSANLDSSVNHWYRLWLFLHVVRKTEPQVDKQPMVRALLAGLCIGLLGMVSYKFLFSGEHELLPLSESYHSLSVIALLVLAFGKTMLTHLCFDCGWRGGKIFPAILASATIGFAFVSIFPYTPGLIVGVMVAASITVILQKPLLTATLLLLLLPLQFFPAVLLTCFVTQWLTKKVNQRMAETA